MKHTRRRNSRRNKKGGFLNFFSNKSQYVAPSEECDINNLSTIKGSASLHENYQKCCPKGMFGTKNSSPYCKQIDLNFQAALKDENESNEYQGFQPDEAYEMKMADGNLSSPTKPWYKFWGGKTRRNKRNKKHKKRTYRRK